MKISNKIQKYLNYILWYIILITITIYISFLSYENTKLSYDNNKFVEIKIKKELIYKEFVRNSDFIFQIIKCNELLVSLISQINTADSTKATYLRKRIYEEITNLGVDFENLGIFKLYLIRNNKTIFLRYFNPEQYNDSFEYQNLLNKVIITKMPQSGFVPGANDFSYRTIYPLILGNNNTVFIEFALSEVYFSQALSFDKSRLTTFNYNFDYIKTPIPKNLMESPFLKGYYIPKKTNDTLPEIHGLFKFFSEKIPQIKDIQKIANRHRDFNFHFEGINQMRSVYFIPIYTQDNVFCGYLMHGFNNITLKNQLFDLILINVAFAGFLIILFFIIAYRKNSIEKLEQKIKELQTEKKRSERLITQLNKSQLELKEKAEFVTKINNLLHEQDILLRKTLDEKNRFFSILAHDIKNPISSLYTNSELLTLYFDKMDDNEKKEIVNKLFSSSKHLERLVKDLLEWGKLQLGQYTIELKEIALRDEIDRIFETYSESAYAKGISFENLIPENTIITSDTHIVRTIFRNLMQNSIKFTENGKIRVEVVEQTEQYLKIAFQDSGVGIPQDKIQDLFKVDKAFSTRGTRDEEGTGLGLILIYEYIKKIEGNISVESKIGAGTTFFVTLPK